MTDGRQLCGAAAQPKPQCRSSHNAEACGLRAGALTRPLAVSRLSARVVLVCRSVPAEEHDFAALLEAELASVERRFDENELAFLALTSKIELPIRDRLAYALFRALPGCRIAREWRRVDLAVLSCDEVPVPLMLLEAKALYSFDLVGANSWVERYPAKVERDLAKLRDLPNVPAEAKRFALVLVTHPAGPIGSQLKHVAKYASGIAKAVKDRGDADAVAEEARRCLDFRLKGLGTLRTGVIPAGEAYDVPLEIQYWLVGAGRSPAASSTRLDKQ